MYQLNTLSEHKIRSVLMLTDGCIYCLLPFACVLEVCLNFFFFCYNLFQPKISICFGNPSLIYGSVIEQFFLIKKHEFITSSARGRESKRSVTIQRFGVLIVFPAVRVCVKVNSFTY